MKTALKARNPNLYSPPRLIEAAEQRGHEVQAIDTPRVYTDIASHRPAMRYKAEKLEGFDAVIPQIGASVTFFGTAVLLQFEIMGVYPLNESVAISRLRDKPRSLQLLARKGIGLPVTVFPHSSGQADDILDIVRGAPVVIRLPEGTQGLGVVLGETPAAAKSMSQALDGLRANILVQDYIKEARGQDIRCLVVGAKVVASMRRQGAEGDCRSNPRRGGIARRSRLRPGSARLRCARPRSWPHCVRRRPVAIQSRTRRHGGEFDTGSRGCGESDRTGCRGRDPRLP